MILPPSPHALIRKLFRYRKFSETEHRKVPLRSFSELRDKKMSTEIRDIGLLSIKLFDIWNYWNTKRFLYEVFRHCETKNFGKKNCDIPYPPFIHKFFRYQKFCETQKVSPTKFFGTVKQQIFYRKTYIPLLGMSFFDNRNFLKHRRVPLRNDSVLWDKTILTENCDTRFLSYP